MATSVLPGSTGPQKRAPSSMIRQGRQPSADHARRPELDELRCGQVPVDPAEHGDGSSEDVAVDARDAGHGDAMVRHHDLALDRPLDDHVIGGAEPALGGDAPTEVRQPGGAARVSMRGVLVGRGHGDGRVSVDRRHESRVPWELERETGIEPATNGLGSRDSTTELLPPVPRASILTESTRIQLRISSSTSSRRRSISSRAAASRFSRSRGSVLDGLTLKCQVGYSTDTPSMR